VRTLAAVVAAAGAGFVLAAFTPAASAAPKPAPATARHPAVALSHLERGVLADINAYRERNHLRPLRLSASLTAAARQHSDEMASDGYFDHASVNGAAFWTRIERYYAPTSRRYWSVGENLLWESPAVSASHALQLWIASPEHKKNLLTPDWREIGISAVHIDHAPGAYHGLDVTIVTTDFGVRR